MTATEKTARVDRGGLVWAPTGMPNVETHVGYVVKLPRRGRTNKIGMRWYPTLLTHVRVGRSQGYEARWAAVAALLKACEVAADG